MDAKIIALDLVDTLSAALTSNLAVAPELT